MTHQRKDRRLRRTPGLSCADSLLLSIVVPVYNSPHLRTVLAAIERSDLGAIQRELIVVDDASTDDSAEIAAGYADLVIRLAGSPRGPAYARNRGAETARGEFIAFVDADVVVTSDALRRMVDSIMEDPTIGAVMGSYQSNEGSSSVISDYRNLLREFEHQADGGDTDVMSAGLVVVRREALCRAGLFDEWRFQRPQVEALELGDRIRAAGFRLCRQPAAGAVHLKQWTVPQWITVDLVDRAVAVARLNQASEFRARAQRYYVATPVGGLLALATVVTLTWTLVDGRKPVDVGALAVASLFTIGNWELIAHFARKRGVLFSFLGVALHVIASATQLLSTLAGRLLFHTVGEPQPAPLVQAWSEVGVQMWPPVPARRGTATLRLRPLGNTGEVASEGMMDATAALD